MTIEIGRRKFVIAFDLPDVCLNLLTNKFQLTYSLQALHPSDIRRCLGKAELVGKWNKVRAWILCNARILTYCGKERGQICLIGMAEAAFDRLSLLLLTFDRKAVVNKRKLALLLRLVL